MEQLSLLEALDAEKVLRTALRHGGGFADLFAEEKTTTLIELEAERVERLVQGRRSGAGVRVLHSHRVSYSYTDLLTQAALGECADIASLAVNDGGPREPVPARQGWDRRRLAVAEPPEALEVKDKLDLMWRAEHAARRLDPRVRQVKVIYADQERRIAVVNSEGLAASDAVTYVTFYVIVVAGGDAGIQVAHESIGGTTGLELFRDHDPEEVARIAVGRALRNLDARPAPAGTMTVVLASEAGGTMIHEAVGHGLEADLAAQGLSVYEDRIGEEIASPLITVIDDATLAGRRGSFSIDDEGSPAERTVLIDRGVLKGYLFDRRMAMKFGAVSTGNGRRETYAFPPIVRMTNTMIAPGVTPPADILRSVDRGLLVKRMGGGEVNTVSGDFVFEVEEGWLIERGAATEPVRGATLTGNGPKVLKQIDLVGSDLGFGLGTCGKDGQGVPVADAQPTLRIPAIVVGGRVE
jgi:TldD protein